MHESRSTRRIAFLFIKQNLYIPDLYAGTEMATHGLCLALMRHNHKCAVAALGGVSPAGVTQSTALGYPVFRGLIFEDTVAAAVDEIKPDVVVYQEPNPQGWAKLRGAIRHLPLLLYHHSIYPGMAKIYRFDDMAGKRDVRSIANSSTTKELLLRLGINTSIIPPILGLERHKTCQRSGDEILMVSVQYRKGTDLALKIAEHRPAARFNIVKTWGSQEELDRYGPWIDRLANVTLHENMPDLSGLLKASKLLLMPSLCAEAWGRTASEAQLWGIPVLGSSRGHLPKTIGAGGLTLDPEGDFAGWLYAFDRILADAAYYTGLARAARARGREILRIADRYLRDFIKIAYELAACAPVLMPKMSHAGEHHGDAGGVGGGDDFRIAD